MRDSAQRPAGEDCGRYRLSTISLLCAVFCNTIHIAAGTAWVQSRREDG